MVRSGWGVAVLGAGLAAVLAAGLALSSGDANARSVARHGGAMPVMIGGQTETDACASIGRVLQPAGSPLVIVSARPARRARAVAKLAAGHLLWICWQNKAANKVGVVFGTAAESRNSSGIPADCGVQTPIAKPRAYHGRCQSGWIDSAAFETIAG